MIKEIYKEFTFEAAHSLPDANEQNKNIHGHSFKVQVYVKGELDSHKGWITDFSVLEQSLLQIKDTLDHKYLNSIEGLQKPTLEILCSWVWDKLVKEMPNLNKVVVKRESLGEGCVLSRENTS